MSAGLLLVPLIKDADTSSSENAYADTVFCDNADAYADANVATCAADPRMRMRISNYIDL